jgi:hypothetical protein
MKNAQIFQVTPTKQYHSLEHWVEIHQCNKMPLLSWKDSRVLVELLEYTNLEFPKIY